MSEEKPILVWVALDREEIDWLLEITELSPRGSAAARVKLKAKEAAKRLTQRNPWPRESG